MNISYDILPDHMRGAAQRYIEHGIAPGGFLRAILGNELIQSFQRADATNFLAIEKYVRWLYNDIPFLAYGSPAKVDAWIRQGGLDGWQKDNEPAIEVD